jgi:uncharacterized phage-associated protein
MAFKAIKVANSFLELAWANGKGLSPMKLQKLVYFAHGWRLAIEDEELIKEPIEVWPYGPVIEILYRKFRSYGNGSIKKLAADFAFQDGVIKVVKPKIQMDNPVNVLLDRIWQIYGNYTAIQLSNITHEVGSPWHTMMSRFRGHRLPKNTSIPNDLIREHFKKKIKA